MIQIVPISKDLFEPKDAQLLIIHVLRYNGLPSVFLCNSDSVIMSKFWYFLYRIPRTKVSPSSDYHPEIVARTETGHSKFAETDKNMGRLWEVLFRFVLKTFLGYLKLFILYFYVLLTTPWKLRQKLRIILLDKLEFKIFLAENVLHHIKKCLNRVQNHCKMQQEHVCASKYMLSASTV